MACDVIRRQHVTEIQPFHYKSVCVFTRFHLRPLGVFSLFLHSFKRLIFECVWKGRRGGIDNERGERKGGWWVRGRANSHGEWGGAGKNSHGGGDDDCSSSNDSSGDNDDYE